MKTLKQILINTVSVFLIGAAGWILADYVNRTGVNENIISPALAIAFILSAMAGLSVYRISKMRIRLSQLGIKDVFFSRDALQKQYTVIRTLARAEDNSEIFVVGRSSEAWSNEFGEIESAIASRGLNVVIVVADPELDENFVPVKDDWAKDDLEGSIAKFSRIHLPKGCKGSFKLYTIPTYVIFSFASFHDIDNGPTGILELGADLSLSKRVAIIFKKSEMLSRLVHTYKKLLHDRNPVFHYK